MEVEDFNKVLSKALDIVDVGIKKGYFDENRKEELNNKLVAIFNNGIVYDLPGTAVYGMYYPSEKKLYFNAKVFKNEEEALVYILHEIKHGLDHYDESIGFEYQDKGVGMNEGATQRFATDVAEEILQIEFPRNIQSSLGIQFNTHLDEYQIEDKLNELFCIAVGISMNEFIKMQNNPQKEEFKGLIDKFNQHASYEIFRESLDQIYMIQEETWFDENHNMLDKEKEPTTEQTKRAMELISRCKKILLKYAERENPTAVDRIKEVYFMAINEYGEIIRDSYDEPIRQTNSEENDVMSEENIVMQADYINYQQNILNQIGSSVLNNECAIIFITEFRYEDDNCEKIVYFRKGDSYRKIIIPMKDDKTIDIANISVQKVDDVNEIKISIEDCEAEFGVIANAPEYARILSMSGDDGKAQSILNKWNYFLSRQNELEQIRQRVEEQHRAFSDEMERLRSLLRDGGEIEASQQSYFDTLFNKTIEYGNIVVSEDGITIINSDGSIKFATVEEEEQYISQIRSALENGEISLNRVQLGLLDSYINGNTHKKM